MPGTTTTQLSLSNCPWDLATAPDVMSRMVVHFGHRRWLATNNRYAGNAVDRLKDELKTANGGKIRQPLALAQTSSASVPLHSADAWDYWAAGLHAHALGRNHVARHLAYYSELRASMALLAAGGLAALNHQHVAFRLHGPGGAVEALLVKPPKNAKTTHPFVWKALNKWAQTDAPATLIYQAIQPGGLPLGEWLKEFGIDIAAKRLVSRWLSDWGLDLKTLDNDRMVRNTSSYWPSRVRRQRPLTPRQRAQSLVDFWSMLIPNPTARFDRLDRELLRRVLSWARRTGIPGVQQDPQKFSSQVKNVIANMGLSGIQAKTFAGHLTTNTQTFAKRVFDHAKQNDKSIDRTKHLHMLARAGLLSRLATGASRQLFKEASITREDLRFWWEEYGLAAGLWGEDPPTSCDELWQDVEDGVRAMRSFLEGHRGTNPGPTEQEFLAVFSEAHSGLTGGERVTLWGMGF